MKKIIKGFFKFIIYILVFLLILTSCLYFSRNLIAEFLIEKGGTSAAGAKVDVEDVYLGLFPASLSWKKLEVANKNKPFYNLFETGETVFGIRVMPLLEGKVLIDAMTVSGLRMNTKREDSGAVDPEEKAEDKTGQSSWIRDNAVKFLEKEKDLIPVFNPELLKGYADIEKLSEKLDLITPVKVEEAKTFINERESFWKERFEKREYEKRFGEIEKDFKNISFDGKMSSGDILLNIERTGALLDKVEKLKKDLKEDRILAKNDLQKIKDYKENFPVWLEQDLKKAEKLISIDNISVEKAAEMLFGKKFAAFGVKAFDMVARLRSASENSVSDNTETASRPGRFDNLPKLWIKEAAVSAIPGDFTLMTIKGRILNISSDQNKTGEPITFDLKGEDKKFGILNFKGTADYRGNKKQLDMTYDLKNYLISNMNLSGDDDFPVLLKKGDGFLNGSLKSEEKLITLDFNFAIKNTSFEMTGGQSSKLKETILDSLENVTDIEMSGIVMLKENSTEFEIKSSVDSLVTQVFGNYIRNEAGAAQNKLKALISAEMDGKKSELYQLIENAGFLDKIIGYQSLVEKKESGLKKEKKNLRDKTEDELRKKGEKFLKNLEIKL